MESMVLLAILLLLWTILVTPMLRILVALGSRLLPIELMILFVVAVGAVVPALVVVLVLLLLVAHLMMLLLLLPQGNEKALLRREHTESRYLAGCLEFRPRCGVWALQCCPLVLR